MACTAETTGVPWPWNVSDGSWTWELFSALPEDGTRYEVTGGLGVASTLPASTPLTAGRLPQPGCSRVAQGAAGASPGSRTTFLSAGSGAAR